MRRLLLISLATIPLAGCQFFNRDGNTAVDIVESVESGEALKDVPVLDLDGKTAEDKANFEEPTVASKPTAAGSPDLIPSTNPDSRARAVSRSRIDPFASLAIPPTPDPIVVSPVAAAGNRVSNAGGSAAGSASAGSANGAGGAGGRSSSRAGSGSSSSRNSGGSTAAAARRAPTPPPVRVQPTNRPLVIPSPIAVLPTIPQPVIAPTVSVSGVIQLGNEPYAIVRSSSEPERYVKVGDRIAGGSVRVKRIETLAFEPRVILEENGIEVSRPIVGDSSGDAREPEAPEPVAVPAAAVPGRQPVLLPTLSAVPALPAPVPMSSLQTNTLGSIPGSLLLQPAAAFQAVLPNLQVPVPTA
ncbi:MAG: hypothetical protein WBA76_20385 [Phormidesmis sp.]